MEAKCGTKWVINQNAYMHAVYIFSGGLKQDIYNGRERQRRSNDRERLHMDAYLQLHTVKPYKQRHHQFQRLHNNPCRRNGAELKSTDDNQTAERCYRESISPLLRLTRADDTIYNINKTSDGGYT